MREYVEKVLHTRIDRRDVDLSLPLYLKGLFRLEEWEALGTSFLVAYPQEALGVKALEGHAARLRAASGLPVAFAFGASNRYRVGRMVEEGVPFVVEGEQVYLPFMGVSLSKGPRRLRIAPDVEKVSVQTQRFVLKAIYRDWREIGVTQAAEALGVAKMTMTRTFDELESIEPGWVKREGRARLFRCDEGGGRIWEKARPHLFNPVVREYRLADDMGRERALPLGGLSALSEYTMIADDAHPTFAATKQQEREWGLRDRPAADKGDAPGCIVQVMRYPLDGPEGRARAIDPLSAVLSLSDDEREDPRTEGEVAVLLERVFAHELEGIG